MNKLQCPKCHKYKILKQREIALIFIIFGVLLVFIFVGIVPLIIGIYLFIKGDYYCQSCGYKWKPGEKFQEAK